jgi:RNA polymerase sigma-70 factor (ECF subfamily)
MSTVFPAGEARPADDDLEQYRVALTRHCARMLGSHAEAEDAVQETLLRAWRSRARFDGRCRLGSWLHRIATNVCIDMLNVRSRRPTPADPASLQAAPLEAGAEADPAEHALAQETFRLALLVAVERLPARQRAVLMLREALCWKANEVAELLGITDAAVNSALQRARASLQSSGPVVDSTISATIEDSRRNLLASCLAAVISHDSDAHRRWTFISL